MHYNRNNLAKEITLYLRIEKQQTVKVTNRTLTINENNLLYYWQRIKDTLFSNLQEKPEKFKERQNKISLILKLILANFIIDYVGRLVDIQASLTRLLIFLTFYKRPNSLF